MRTILRVSQQTAWQLIGKVVTTLTTIFILGLVSRKFGQEGTGVFTLVLTYLAFFYLASDLGINAYILPHLKTNIALEWRKLVGLRLILSLSLITVALLLLPLLPFSNNLFAKSVLIAVLAIIFSSIFVSTNAVFQSKLRYDLSVLAASCGTLAATLLIFLFVSANLAIPFLLLAHLFGWLIDAGLALIFVKRFVHQLKPIFDLSYAKKVISEVWPVSLTLVLNVVYFRLDAFILGGVKSFAEVGVYNLAYQIFQSALVLPTFIMNSYYPLMLRRLSLDERRFWVDLRKALLIMLGLGVMGMVFTSLVAGSVVAVITGSPQFSGSVTSLKILSLGFPAFFLSSVLMWTLVALKKYQTLLLVYLAGLIFNAALNLILIPHYSYLASAALTGAAEYLILLLELVILAPKLLRR